MAPCKTFYQPRSPPTQTRLVKLMVKFSFKFITKPKGRFHVHVLDFVLNVCLALLNARSHRLDEGKAFESLSILQNRVKHMTVSWCNHGVKIQM